MRWGWGAPVPPRAGVDRAARVHNGEGDSEAWRRLGAAAGEGGGL